MDRDPEAVAAARSGLGGDPRVTIVHAPFSRLADAVDACGRRADGVLLDLGVSSPQLDDPARGFSFLRDGPLDMRMDPGAGESAAQWLARVAERDLARLIADVGEVRFARRFARAIVAARAEAPILTTGRLAAVVAAAVPTREPGKHPGTRTFQALRIHVNRELEELDAALPQALERLAPGGRLAVISFHSLEDRHGDREPKAYGVAYWYPAQNPLMRKFNIAARQRATAGARADWTGSEAVSVSFVVDYANDDYDETQVGLTQADSVNLAADVTWAVSENTRLYAFVQGEKTSPRQAGSQTFAPPDWTGKVDDDFGVLGLGVKHAAIPDKLNIGADLWISRARSDVTVQTGVGEPPFPTAKTSRDVFKLYANYKLDDKTWLDGSWWYESYTAHDWRLDGVQPNTVYDLLAFGNQAPRYNQNVVRVSVRYQF